MKKETSEKLLKLSELLKQKDQIEAQIELLLNPVPKIPLPDGFSVNDKIIDILKQYPEGKYAKDILNIIQIEQPSIESPKVNAALVYLSSPLKNQVERVSRGLYKLKTVA